MSRILVADDQAAIRRLVCDYLKKAGFETLEAEDGTDTVEKFEKYGKEISLIICDIMMPGLDGWEVTRHIRKTSTVPIIMLTARELEFDEVSSFESGADDFITKPFSGPVLVKRVQALLKRAAPVSVINTEELVAIDGVSVNLSAHTVTYNKTEIELTAKEYDVLVKLMTNPNRIYSRDNLIDSIWGIDFAGDPRTIDSHIARLRIKLGEWGDRHLKTVYGAGYKIEVNEA